MSSAAGQYFQNSQYYQQNPNIHSSYIPMVNVPTTNRLPTQGEIVTSIELLIAQVGELSRKIDRVESRVNDWVNLSIAERMTIAEKGITALKTCHNEHSAKIHTSEKEIDDLFGYLKEVKEDTNDNYRCIDRVSDVLSHHTSKLRHAKQRSRDLAKKYAEIGILRRRVSKCEDFNTEFAECFEAPLQLRGIISNMSDKVDECDRTISYMVRYGSDINAGGSCAALDNTIPEYSTFCDEYDGGMLSPNTLDEYFSNYCDEEEHVSVKKDVHVLDEDEDDDFVEI
jgi:hypothetical protein